MPRQAIVCKYVAPTNHRDAHIRVKAQAGAKNLPWDDAADCDANMERAATTYALDMGWLGAHGKRHSKLCGGSLPDGSAVFVLVSIAREAE
jgi:hypothetical protein